MIGHTKTILILTGGWLFFNDQISGQQVLGICVAIMGMILYSYSSMRWVFCWLVLGMTLTDVVLVLRMTTKVYAMYRLAVTELEPQVDISLTEKLLCLDSKPKQIGNMQKSALCRH